MVQRVTDHVPLGLRALCENPNRHAAAALSCPYRRLCTAFFLSLQLNSKKYCTIILYSAVPVCDRHQLKNSVVCVMLWKTFGFRKCFWVSHLAYVQRLTSSITNKLGNIRCLSLAKYCYNLIYIIIHCVSGDFFNPEYDMCYCKNCHRERKDRDYYQRGDPPKLYGLPLGWCRFALL